MEKINSVSSEFPAQSGLLKSIKQYIKKSEKIQIFLNQNPTKWWMLQEEFNSTLDLFSMEIGSLEKKKNEKMFYKAKNFFIKRLRSNFLHGHYINTSFQKPYGYAGDFKIIDDIYQSKTRSTGYERLWDNYFLRMGPSIATRNRKEDFKRILTEFIFKKNNSKVRVMDLASGPCRELKELFDSDPELMKNVQIDCYDFDDNAISYASNLLKDQKDRVAFYKKNAIKLALKRDICSEISYKYDFIFSTGLFDYLDDRIAVRLVKNLKKLLVRDGVVCISNYLEKDRNLWAPLMEWVAEWNLIYRTNKDFIKVFLEAGFDMEKISFEYEPLMIMQYCLATN